MNNSRFPIISVVVLLALLGVLATLQYRWLGEISDAGRERMQKRLEADTEHFAEEFNREIRDAYFTFQIDPSDWLKKDWTEFNRRYELWRSKTKYPQLIEDFYFVGKDAPPLRYNAQARGFEPAEWTEKLSQIRERIDRHQKEDLGKPVVLDSFALLTGNYAAGEIINFPESRGFPRIEPELSGYLLIKLDETVVKRFVADLAAKYFSNGDRANYNLSIFNKADSKIIYQNPRAVAKAEEASDAQIEIFDLTNDTFRLVVNSQLFARSKSAEATTTRKITESIALPMSPPAAPKMDNADSLKVFLEDQLKKPKEVKKDGLWILKIQHSDGSLERFIEKARRRNLAISFGILALLAASGILVIVSAQRVKLLAQRQMDFVSAVSHEFRTPLAVIYSAGENLTDGVVSSEKQIAQYGNLIVREGKKLTAMVEQILEFAGARSGHKKYDFRETDMKTVVEKALAECRNIIAEKSFEVETEIAENIPNISADANALSHAIQNLIINAVKYSDADKWIKVSAGIGGGQLKIAVEDKGIGIAPKDVANIFAPFYRAKSVVDAQIHGNGLGLSLVKQTVEAHGGKVFVETETGKGSKFIIQLPVNKKGS